MCVCVCTRACVRACVRVTSLFCCFQGVVIRDGVLVSGTLEDLIILLQPTAKHHPDVSWVGGVKCS